jgi:hypothetical protein
MKVPVVPSYSSTIITIDNWDNFNLGIDLASSMMTANPAIPSWYFTAYNTNTGHQSEDGLNWLALIPDFGSTIKGDPVVAYDSLGNLFYGNMFGTNIVLGMKVIKSTDNGITWGPGITALSGTDKCWIACDQTNGPYANYVYTCMTNSGVGNFSRSMDHGQTFTSTFAPPTQSLPGMMVCVGPNNNIQGGSVYVVTNSGTAFATIYTFYRSNDGGLTFDKMSTEQFSNYVGSYVNGRNSVSGMRTRPYPMIAADNSYGPHRGRLYLVYASNNPPGNGNMPDIFSRYSDNGGVSWSEVKIVNDDVGSQNNSQWHPAIWCDKNDGRLYVQWMDTRDTPTHDSAYIYATYSSDGGVTFAPNQRISNQKMQIDCPTCGGGGNPGYQGDYNGIYSNEKGSMASWTDFRFGTFMSTTAYFPDFAMAISSDLDTLFTPVDSTLINISIPAVKLYTDTVLLSDSIYPVPISGSITVSFPSGNKIVEFPDSLPAKVELNGAVPPGDYLVQFMAKSPNGTPVHQRNTIIRVLLGDAVYVTATATPDSICPGVPSQLMAKTVRGKSPFTFSWTPTTGLNNPNIANPVASPVVSTWYHVHVVDSVSHTATDSILIRVIHTPITPGAINGPLQLCDDSIAVYSVQTVPDATSYSWMVPSDAQILSGQNTPSITVHWGSSGGIISVIAGNKCGNSNPTVIEVTLTGPPSSPAIIQGPSKTCNGTTVSYTVDPVPGATYYFWTVPSDAVILSGQNSDSISVLWGPNAGNVSIVARNTCGESIPLIRFIGLETLPPPAGEIIGTDTVCSNQETYSYSVQSIVGATSYSWTIPNGTTIISGLQSNAMVLRISPSAMSGAITVQGHNSCGVGASSLKNIIVKVCTGIAINSEEPKVLIYPNPAESALNIITNLEGQFDLKILDLRGQVVYQKSCDNSTTEFIHKIDVSAFSRGIFFLKLTGNTTFAVKKIILQ